MRDRASNRRTTPRLRACCVIKVAARIRSMAAGEARSFSSTSAVARGCESGEVLDGSREAGDFFIARCRCGDRGEMS